MATKDWAKDDCPGRKEMNQEIENYINRRLSNWFQFIGIGNMGALLAAAGYIIFLLPDQLAERASGRVAQRVEQAIEDTTDARGEAFSKIMDLHDELGQTREKLDQTRTRVLELETGLDTSTERHESIRAMLEDLESSETTKAVEAIQLLKDNPDVTRFLDLSDRLKRAVDAARDRWPRGQYCIIRAEQCPASFRRVDVSLKALKVLNSSSVVASKEGSSIGASVNCHDKKRCTVHANLADLNLSVCCK